MNSTNFCSIADNAGFSTAEINVFTMLIALGFPAEVAAAAASPETFSR